MAGSGGSAHRFAAGWRAWLVAAVLALPVVWLYFAHMREAPPGFGPTGFIHYEQLYYMANARELLDRGGALTYGNPFSFDYATAPVYFQPINLLLALALHIAKADPGAVYMAFGAIAAVACLRAIIALYQAVIPLEDRAAWLGLLLFSWGGGLLQSAGLLGSALAGGYNPFAFDPARGWWFLNLGRNLVFPTEAFYHLVFFGAILMTLRQRWGPALILAALLSASHPFTGIQLLGILLGWATLERFLLGNRQVPAWFPIALAALMGLHAGYYLAFLNSFAEHHSLFQKWRTYPSILKLPTMIFAYILVAEFALWQVRTWPLARAYFAQPDKRLLAVWFAGSFALANNELVMSPIQPLHFTRGYIWTPLFLLGAPLLVKALRELLGGPGIRGRLGAALLSALFLLDNAIWFATIPQTRLGIYLSPGERALFVWLSTGEQRGAVILADPELSYAATAYTPLRGWYTHDSNTPYALRRRAELLDFLATGRLPPGREATPFLIVRDTMRDDNPRVLPAGRDLRLVYRKGTIAAWRVEPVAPLNPPPPSSRPPGSSAR